MVHYTISVTAVALYLVALEAATSCSAQLPSHDISSCLLSNGVKNFSLPGSPSYTPLLDSSIRNRRFEIPSIGKPAALVLPASKQELQRAVLCARASLLAIRVRSGGHSSEGLSYTTENHVPFVVIDLSSLNRVRVDLSSSTAWVESGATVGEVYHAVGRANRTLAFSAGSCSTLGMGGHIAGGGFGMLSRKFGLAADNVVDAVLIDPSGKALTRDTMDDDVFWAIRGGGGGSWGVVYAWKIQLVPVPTNITMFTVPVATNDNIRDSTVERIAKLIHKWQHVGPNLPDEFHLSVYVSYGSEPDGNISMSFTGQVLGPKHLALSVLNQRFPELGLTESHVWEMSWLEAAVMSAELSTIANLTDRQPGVGRYTKSKSDYVQTPISLDDMIRIFRYLWSGPLLWSIELSPYGGAMARIASTATPFPHRAGNLYSIQYGILWAATQTYRAAECIAWLRSFYAFMAPHVSKHPRGAYVNYLDLDLGTNDWKNATGGTSNDSVIRAASSWGRSYFLHNFERLVQAKTKVDPGNVFNNAQSIPPLPYDTVKH